MSKKSVFPTMYDTRTRRVTNSGSRFKIEYKAKPDKVDNKLSFHLEEAGRIDTYGLIQSYKEATELDAIIARYMSGDTSALQRAQAMYADMTSVPKTMIEFLNVAIQTENIFEQLPMDVRRKYNHDYRQLIAIYGTPEFAEALGYKPVSEPVSEPVSVPVTELVTKGDVVNA